jgi:hypothetical protein
MIGRTNCGQPAKSAKLKIWLEGQDPRAEEIKWLQLVEYQGRS